MRNLLQSIIFIALTHLYYTSYADTKVDQSPASIEDNELSNFDNYPPKVKSLIKQALGLTKKNLTYQYASDRPENGGMDCSGTIYYLLHTVNKIDIPRDTELMYKWIVKHGQFHSVSEQSFSSKEFDALEPGDLLFWTGTWNVPRQSGISHVMLYLGTDRLGNKLMFGSSNGRTYKGRKIWGVSVFDFLLPSKNSKAKFIGYSCIPIINCE